MKLVDLIVSYMSVSVGGAGGHPGPHEGHEQPDGVGGAGGHPGPHEGHELPDSVGGTGRHPRPHERHELPDCVGGAGRHPRPHERHELAQELVPLNPLALLPLLPVGGHNKMTTKL